MKEGYHHVPVVRINRCAPEEVCIYNDPGLKQTYVARKDIKKLIKRLKRHLKEKK